MQLQHSEPQWPCHVLLLCFEDEQTGPAVMEEVECLLRRRKAPLPLHPIACAACTKLLYVAARLACVVRVPGWNEYRM